MRLFEVFESGKFFLARGLTIIGNAMTSRILTSVGRIAANRSLKNRTAVFQHRTRTVPSGNPDYASLIPTRNVSEDAAATYLADASG